MDQIEEINKRMRSLRKNKNLILTHFCDAYAASLEPTPKNVKEFIERVELYSVECWEGGVLLKQAIGKENVDGPSFVSKFIIKEKKPGALTISELTDKAIELRNNQNVNNYYKDALQLVLCYINDPLITAEFNL